MQPRGIRLIVYTRFDSQNNDPLELAFIFGRLPCAMDPAVDFELYNCTGNTVAGVHYDPVCFGDVSEPHTESRDTVVASVSRQPHSAEDGCIQKSSNHEQNVLPCVQHSGVNCVDVGNDRAATVPPPPATETSRFTSNKRRRAVKSSNVSEAADVVDCNERLGQTHPTTQESSAITAFQFRTCAKSQDPRCHAESV